MPTRRDFLLSACGIAALGLTPALLANEAMAADGIIRKPNGQVVVTVNKVPGLAKVGGSVNLGTVKGKPVAVVRTGTSTYRALSLACPHQGVTVARSGSNWRCPAHGSTFTADGTFVAGPAEGPLSTVPAKLSGKTLTVG
ncbi:MAG: Rieske 2Fe-2S domain-containing protein [Actinomycetota bacterium]|nr:Rieske 2Fe-2S domain-containing protein [Actinomycetota bacterium]